MQQVKVSINEKQMEFLRNHQSFGFKDKSSLVRKAIDYFRKEIENQKLKKSADLYCEIYDDDSELQDLTNSAISDWPE
jgi:Arc/MetJ-type ribon-helix-helix transcriptional regulator